MDGRWWPWQQNPSPMNGADDPDANDDASPTASNVNSFALEPTCTYVISFALQTTTAVENVEMAHTRLLRTLTQLTSNRTLAMKLTGVLLLFVTFFVVFLA